MNARKEPPVPAAPLHRFTPNPDAPHETFIGSGLRVCQCGKPGREGDDQHPVDGPPLVAAFDRTEVLRPTPEGDRSPEILGEGRDD